MGFIFDNVLVNPMLNALVVLYSILFSNFGLSIIVFTVLVRLATMPLHLKQINQMRKMQVLQPRMKEIQARNAKDPKKRSADMMGLYKEAGVNPLGCLGPMVIQLPIWIGLYQALLKALGTHPDGLVGPFPEAVLLEPGGRYHRAPQQRLPLAGPGQPRSHSHTAGVGGGVHLGPAKR